MKISLVVIFITFYASIVSAGEGREGDWCFLKNGELGSCKLYQNCTWAIELFRNGIKPIICGVHQNHVRFVCCRRERFIIHQNITFPENDYDDRKPNRTTDNGHFTINYHSTKFTRKYEFANLKSTTEKYLTSKPSNYVPQPSNLLPIQEDNLLTISDNYEKPKPSNLLPAGPWDDYFQSTTKRAVISSYYTTRRQQPIKKTKRISEIKCREYSKFVVETIAGLPLTANPNPIHIDVQKCNYQAQELIVGGEKASNGEFPHMAAVGFLRKQDRTIQWRCGGTLISENFVLTAAHCTISRSLGPPTVVRLGELNLQRRDDGANPVDYVVTEFIKHHKYLPPSRYNDLALLRLSRPVKFSEYIRPACLYIKAEIKQPKSIATGWGRVEYGDIKQSDDLLKVVLPFIDNYKCNSMYKAESKTQFLPQGIIESQVCAGDLAGGRDTCQGDSGGPIGVTKMENQCIHYVVGVTSFGKHCAQPDAPGVYTRVSAYLDWIESIVWPNENTTTEHPNYY